VRIFTVSRLALVPPMSISEIEELPEELREIFLAYIRPLDEKISALLHSTGENEFERNFDKVISEFSIYLFEAGLTLDEGYVKMLLDKYLSGRYSSPPAQSPLAQTLADANEIIANFIRLMIEPDYRDYVLKHPDVFMPYMELLVLTYILGKITKSQVEPSMVEKITRRCQEATWNVESYVDTIEIDADHEASAALERIKQTTF
jgi:hypothetical protein